MSFRIEKKLSSSNHIFKCKVPAPWGYPGFVSFIGIPEEFLVSVDFSVPDDILNSLLITSPSVLNLALLGGVSTYAQLVVNVLVEAGLETDQVTVAVRDSWPIIYAGGSQFSATLRDYLNFLKWQPMENSYSIIRTSKMHLWCFLEIARAYSVAFADNKDAFPELYADLQASLVFFEPVYSEVMEKSCPYVFFGLLPVDS